MIKTRWIPALVLLTLGSAPACSKPAQTTDALMKDGLDALYVKKKPDAAVQAFRKVLAKDPAHYGANFQLAKALDLAGKPAEALPQWEKILSMAEAIRDEATADTARKRLGRSQPSAEEAAMKAGLDALYGAKDAAAAVVAFRKVLGMNPNHYGANFQLAKALDLAGNAAEARVQWEKVLKMAESIKDAETTGLAKERLARHP